MYIHTLFILFVFYYSKFSKRTEMRELIHLCVYDTCMCACSCCVLIKWYADWL